MPEVVNDAPILILTGPPRVGKTTVAEVVAERSSRSVHLESDAFFHSIRSGYVEPWKAEAHEQNQIVFSCRAWPMDLFLFERSASPSH